MSEERVAKDLSLPALPAALGQLMRIGPAVDQAISSRGDIGADDICSLERIRTAITFLGKRLDGSETVLLVSGPLEKMSEQFSVVVERIGAFAEDGDSNHLVAANERIDDGLLLATQLTFPRDLEDFQGLREASGKYRKSLLDRTRAYAKGLDSATASVRNLDDRVEKLGTVIDSKEVNLQERISVLKSELEEAKNTHEKRLVDVEKDLQTSLDALKEQLRVQLEEFRANQEALHRGAVESHHKKLESLLENSDQEFQKKVDAWTEAVENASDTSKTTLQKLTDSFETESTDLLSKIRRNLAKADDLVGIIADRAVTSGHKHAADEAQKEVTFWHRVTFGSMMVLIAFAGSSAFGWLGKFDWPMFAGRVYFSLAVLSLAGYAASQASRYQQIERRNRKLQLELTALEPFLEPVSQEEREKFRLKMAEAFFGRDDIGREAVAPTNVVEFLRSKEARELIEETFKGIAKVKS